VPHRHPDRARVICLVLLVKVVDLLVGRLDLAIDRVGEIGLAQELGLVEVDVPPEIHVLVVAGFLGRLPPRDLIDQGIQRHLDDIGVLDRFLVTDLAHALPDAGFHLLGGDQVVAHPGHDRRAIRTLDPAGIASLAATGQDERDEQGICRKTADRTHGAGFLRKL
jgi:hypothetical protein